MANKLISEMGLPKSIGHIFAARNIITAKDALSLTEFELMELLDVSFTQVTLAVSLISEIASPPYQTVRSLLEQRMQNEYLTGHLPTHLKGLDAALSGGIPFGALTELVGPAGIGKTQFCLKISLLATLPSCYGGLDGHVIYIDVESKFSSRRLIEIGLNSFPEIFRLEGMAKEMAGRITVLRPGSLTEFTESLQKIKVSLLQHQVKLLVVDSMAALVSGEYEQGPTRQHPLGWHISFIKSLAEFSRIPVVMTNQVRSRSTTEISQYSFQAENREDPGNFDSHLVAALGIHWAHAVTIRLVLESRSGQRFIKVAKSPMSPPLAFPFKVTSLGIVLLNDDGIEMTGRQINAIDHQGLSCITLGRVLRTKTNDEEWEELLNSEIWSLHNESKILPALRLSYYDLPPHMKQMFAYCSLFPKDYLFDKDELVLLWMGEGFLHESNGSKSMESLGREWFQELESRSFFQQSTNDRTRYTMHDLINDLATSVAREFFFMLDDKIDVYDQKEALEKFHHLSYIHQQYGVYRKFKALQRARRLRTFLALSVRFLYSWRRSSLSYKVLVELLPQLKFLRVLSLANYSIRVIPESIGGLKHLRYLNFTKTYITCLPEQVGDLYNLQSLLVPGCHLLSSLPDSCVKLKNLRHLDISDTPLLNEMPLGIGGLTSLQTLSKIIIGGANGFKISELKGLLHLQGQLTIKGCTK